MLPSLRVFAVILLSVSCSSAYCQRASNARGAGAHSCADFIENKSKDDARGFYGQWALGYMSAYNFFSRHPAVEIPDAATVMLYTEKFCRDNPLSTFSVSVNSLVEELGGWKIPTPKR